VLGQARPPGAAPPGDHFGALTTVQALPFQTSVSGETVPVAMAPLAPTATQCTGELQDTDPSALNVAALGAARTVQAEPASCSVKAVSVVPAWSI
jgi:hypothetical protein